MFQLFISGNTHKDAVAVAVVHNVRIQSPVGETHQLCNKSIALTDTEARRNERVRPM